MAIGNQVLASVFVLLVAFGSGLAGFYIKEYRWAKDREACQANDPKIAADAKYKANNTKLVGLIITGIITALIGAAGLVFYSSKCATCKTTATTTL
jgi:hypothetical protein